MIINHNMSSLYTDRVLNISNDSIMKNMEKLSSGERINRAETMHQDLLYQKRCAAKSVD